MDKEAAYDLIRQVLHDPQSLLAIKKDPQSVLSKLGIQSQDEIKDLEGILSIVEVGITTASQKFDPVQDQQQSTLTTANELKKGLVDVTKQIQSGYKHVMIMYNVAFYLGIALIASAVLFAIFTGESLLPMVFSGIGMADIIVYLITKPPQGLQDSRANLTQLQAAYFSWFVDMVNWNSYLLEKGQKATLDDIKKVSEACLHNTGEMMELIDKYCETGKKPEGTAPPSTTPKN
jgi:hypothetical protein